MKFLRDQVGLVGQEPVLFNTTITENIRYSLPEATQAQVEEAAKQSNAHAFIMEFPDKYNTTVGSGGTLVSGGQKQRIAIARALIKKPRILLLDEATSALDSENEKVVQEALDKIMKTKSQTVIVIAHRLSTIRNADRIAVITDGKVREIGGHDELMAIPDGHYKRLHMFQDLETAQAMKDKMKHLEPSVNNAILQESLKKSETTQAAFGQNEADGKDKNVDKKNAKRAWEMAKPDRSYFFIGAVGAVLAGLVFPGWGVSSMWLHHTFASVLNLLVPHV